MIKKLLLSLLCSFSMVMMHNQSSAAIYNVNIGNFYATPDTVNCNVHDTIIFHWVIGNHAIDFSAQPSCATLSYHWDVNSFNNLDTFVVPCPGDYPYLLDGPDDAGNVTGLLRVAACTRVNTSIVPSGTFHICNNNLVTLHDTTTYAGATFQWYKTGTNDTLIPGANSHNYTPLSSGRYKCVTTNFCGDTTSNIDTISVYNAPSLTITGGPGIVGINTYYDSTGSTGTSTILSNVWIWGDGTPNDTTHFGNHNPLNHHFTTAGHDTITVIACNYNGCCDTIHKYLTLSVEDINNQPVIAINPNPASNSLNIHTFVANTAVGLYDLTGRLIRTLPVKNAADQDNIVNISDVPVGLYIIRVTSENQSTATKLLIQR
ncbi:MAG: T9SS type A sorting domain-containing protein [Bacteroidota bacterium]